MKTAEEILKEIGYDNNSITETEKWIAKELYKKYAQQFASQSSDKEEREPDAVAVFDMLFREKPFPKGKNAQPVYFSPPKESEGKELSEIKYLIKCIANSK